MSYGPAKPLVREFYNRDPRVVARELLGKLLIRHEGRKLLSGRIVETEAYLGTNDAAAHAAAGHTARNAVLFGPPGRAYVYFIYGMHYCLNVSCLPEGDAGCVLIRALAPVEGREAMAVHREILMAEPPRLSQLKNLASGPGRLADAFAITRPRDNGKDLATNKSDLWIGDDGFLPPKITTTARVGITKAAEHPWRFVITGDPFVSGSRAPASGR